MGFTEGFNRLKGEYKIFVGDEVYHSISRKYFPKWEGWTLLENGETNVQQLAEDFYKGYFWYKLKGDSIRDARVSEVLFLASVLSGKKVVIKKVQRILKVKLDGLMSNDLVYLINQQDVEKFVFRFLIEMFDLYHAVSDNGSAKQVLLDYYNSTF